MINTSDKPPRIWVDADACPRVIKDILFRAAERRKVEVILVANQPMAKPPIARVRTIQVAQGFDVADNYISQNMSPEDLVITADIPLAADVVANGGQAINPRGEAYTKENIRQRLSMRNFMEEVRSTGTMTGGPAPLGGREKQAFGNALDRWLTKSLS
jgi:uncharacterized protein YaiI (UPF0178 family)